MDRQTNDWTLVVVESLLQLKISTLFFKASPARRPLKSNRLSYKGPPVTFSLNKPKIIKLICSIKQFIDSQEDQQKKCKNYPNKNFVSFNECDEHFMREKISNEHGVVPFWMSNDFENVTLSK